MRGLDLQSLAETAVAAARSAGQIISQPVTRKSRLSTRMAGIATLRRW